MITYPHNKVRTGSIMSNLSDNINKTISIHRHIKLLLTT